MNWLSKMVRFLLAFSLVVTIGQILIFGVSFTTGFGVGVVIWLATLSGLNNWYFTGGSKVVLALRNLVLGGFLLLLVSFIGVQWLIVNESESTMVSDEVEVDAVIILGSRLIGDQVSWWLADRLQKGLEYIETHPDVPVIVSGGQGSDELVSEATAMGRYLVRRGVEGRQILYEDQSTSTLENIRFSKPLVDELANSEPPKVLIVTSDYHLFRGKMIAEKMGLEAYGLASKSPLTVRVNFMVREYFALAKDWVLLSLN